MSSMILDIIVVLVILLSAVIAFLRGFIKEILSVVGILGALVASYALGGYLDPLCHKWLGVKQGAQHALRIWHLIPPDMMASGLAYGSVFVISFAILFAFSYFVSGLVKEAGLGAIDRSLGVLFGLVRGAVLVVLAFLPFSMLMGNSNLPDWAKNSKSVPMIEATIDWTSGMLGMGHHKSAPATANNGLTNLIGEELGKVAPDKLKDAVKKKTTAIKDAAKNSGVGYDKKTREKLDQLINQGDSK